MSIKTLRKRIALVAVSALGAGLISVVAVPTASATLITNCNVRENAANGGAATTTASNGIIATNCASNPGALLQGVTLYPTGAISVNATVTAAADGTTAAVAQRISVSGGIISSADNGGTTGGTLSIAADKSRTDVTATAVTNGHTNLLRAVATPNSGVTTMTISGWNNYSAGANPAWVVTVTIATASAVGVATVADSSVVFVGSDGADATADVAGANAATSRTPLYLNVQLNDVYGNNVTAGGLVVEVSSGAIVGLSGSAGAAVGALSTSTNSAIALTSSVSPADINIRVQEATAGKGWNGTIKVTWNGLVIATKSGSILGDIAKITVTPTKIGKVGGADSTEAFTYQATDAAGNVVVLTAANLVLSSSSNAGIVSNAVGTNDNSSAAAGKGKIVCAANGYGKSSVVMQTTLAATGAVIKSNAAEFSCAGDPVAYKASFDKASYAQGDIATMTVQFVDALGAPATSMTAVSATANQVISATQMERVTAYPSAQTVDVKGQVTYVFTVGTSSGVVAGKYNAVVSFPTINAIAGANQSVAYEVTAPASVSNAEVLASIVKLIAAINKQIRALQKSLRR